MPDDLNETAVAAMGWFVVATVVGCYLIWRWYEYVKPRRERFDAEWQRRFEPNRQWVPEHRQWTEDDEQQVVDAEYVRLMQRPPDDHMPSDWRCWGDKAGARRR